MIYRILKMDGPGVLWAKHSRRHNFVEGSMFLLLQVADSLAEPIAEYFDKVFVMSEDAAVRQSRLALLRDIANLTSGIVDFAELPGF